jgi:GT2 family glycosyltransferase
VRPRVTVAVLQRESFGHTGRSLESLYATAQAPFDLIYVDAGSPPPVQRLIEDEGRRRGFRVLRQERFLAPNEARNLALPHIQTEFVAFVDNDLIFRDAWLRRLLACADETGAEVAGPLVCIGQPPFRTIHSAGGNAHIEETESGRRFIESHRFLGRRLAAVAQRLIREPVEMVEFHCMLVRRSVFDRLGFLDEKLRTANEHMDLCMHVRQNGGKVVFEPGAIVNHLLPAPFPFDRQSWPFFFERWRKVNNRATIEHFRAKWNLQPDDRTLDATHNWCNDRRDMIFRYLRPAILRHGLRKLRRIFRHLAPRRAGQQTNARW